MPGVAASATLGGTNPVMTKPRELAPARQGEIGGSPWLRGVTRGIVARGGGGVKAIRGKFLRGWAKVPPIWGRPGPALPRGPCPWAACKVAQNLRHLEPSFAWGCKVRPIWSHLGPPLPAAVELGSKARAICPRLGPPLPRGRRAGGGRRRPHSRAPCLAAGVAGVPILPLRPWETTLPPLPAPPAARDGVPDGPLCMKRPPSTASHGPETGPPAAVAAREGRSRCPGCSARDLEVN